MTTDLRTLALFHGCTAREFDCLATQGTCLLFAAGTMISGRGDTGRQLVVVCSGAVVVDHAGSSMRTAGPGDVLDFLATASDNRVCEDTSWHALTHCELLVFDRREFTVLEMDAPQAAMRIRGLSERRVDVRAPRAESVSAVR